MSCLKGFTIKAIKYIPFPLEGLFEIKSSSKRKAKKIFHRTFKGWIIISTSVSNDLFF